MIGSSKGTQRQSHGGENMLFEVIYAILYVLGM